HDLPRLAIAALRRVGLDPGPLHGMERLLAQALDGQNRLACRVADRRYARSRGLTVNQHGAGPAEPGPAAELRADQAQFVTQRPQKGHLRLDINRDFPSVNDKKGHGPYVSDRACRSAKPSPLKRTSEANCRTGAIKSARAANILPCTGPAQAGAGWSRAQDLPNLPPMTRFLRVVRAVMLKGAKLIIAMNPSPRLSLLRVRPLAGSRARGWLTAGPFRFPCALGPSGIVRIKREGDRGTPAGRFRLLWGYYRPDRTRPRAAGVPLTPMRRDQGWCEDPSSPRYNRPVRLPAADCTDRMWRDDHLYDLTFVLDQNFSRRAKGRGSAIFFHLARPGFTPTAGCVAISAADMLKLAPRLARGAVMAIG